MDEVIRADAHAVRPLSEMLTRAFAIDPIACDLFPKTHGRRRRLERFFSVQLRHAYLPRGEILTYPDYAAAALVVWPSAPPLALWHQIATLRAVPLLGRNVLAAQELARAIMATHPTTPYAYLGTIGTDPVVAAWRAGDAPHPGDRRPLRPRRPALLHRGLEGVERLVLRALRLRPRA